MPSRPICTAPAFVLRTKREHALRGLPMALSDLPISSNPTNPLAAQLYLPPPPVVLDPEASSYNTLIARLAAEVRPSDLPEQIWLREVADHIWEIGRVRRAKVST